jgi:hypothetical protein
MVQRRMFSNFIDPLMSFPKSWKIVFGYLGKNCVWQIYKSNLISYMSDAKTDEQTKYNE